MNTQLTKEQLRARVFAPPRQCKTHGILGNSWTQYYPTCFKAKRLQAQGKPVEPCVEVKEDIHDH